ncbi:DUF2332 domain-containing protein [Demequina gelatinilytica]|uniref:DUF2332 domain-containing protein n=1 Tax=Demequina gelatinilytica TaxID=1638980 RepID=UPI000784A968|nr:DUF2332 domain-containing protein [Demequina gelatinilytica]
MSAWLADDPEDLEAVAEAVRAWAPYAVDSPLYSLYATRIAEDPELVEVVAGIRAAPPLNILFAAVQLLLAPDEALAAWYPRLVGVARTPDDAAYEAFRDFVLGRRDDIARLAATRRTQTNEVRRCAVLMPALAHVAATERWEGPVHAIDIGASAGLCLLLDRLAYRYGDAVMGEGPLTVEAELRGGLPLPRAVPRLATRTGLDLSPVDVEDPDQAAWLEALVWPEQGARLARLRAAIALHRETAVTMVAGDATRTLLGIAAALPEGPLVLWHSIAVYQLTSEQQDALDDAVAQVARLRPTARIAFEPSAHGGSDVRLGLRPREVAPVASAHHHGEWIAEP